MDDRKRHFTWPTKLKSRHSFPSGDAAQAANLTFFLLLRPVGMPSVLKLILVAQLWPGVAFARVFYLCHFIEDTIAGLLVGFVVQIVFLAADL